jgi:hypothetical protein
MYSLLKVDNIPFTVLPAAVFTLLRKRKIIISKAQLTAPISTVLPATVVKVPELEVKKFLLTLTMASVKL